MTSSSATASAECVAFFVVLGASFGTAITVDFSLSQRVMLHERVLVRDDFIPFSRVPLDSIPAPLPDSIRGLTVLAGVAS